MIKYAIIGCGNIGLSLLQGLLKEKNILPKNITVTRRNIQELAYLEAKGVRLTTDNVVAIKDSNLIVIAVKPYNITEVLEEIRAYLNPEKHVLISVTAGTIFKSDSGCYWYFDACFQGNAKHFCQCGKISFMYLP